MLNREPEVSSAAVHLWNWFWEMAQGRQVGMSGYLPLSALEMKAWESMTGNIVRREEWQILREMDQAFLRSANAQGKDGQPVASSSHEISADAFDAVFG